MILGVVDSQAVKWSKLPGRSFSEIRSGSVGPSSTRGRIPTVNYTKVCRRFVQPVLLPLIFLSSYLHQSILFSLSFVLLLYLPSHFLVISPESTKQNINTFEHVKVVKWKHLKLQMKRPKTKKREKYIFTRRHKNWSTERETEKPELLIHGEKGYQNHG